MAVRSAADQKIVADIFWRRIAAGQALQADSTVNYCTGGSSPSVSTADTKVTCPWNTYKYPGLPAGPIGNPGLSALTAANGGLSGTGLSAATLASGTATYTLPIPAPAPNRYHRDWVAMKDIPGLIAELQAEVERRQEELPALRRYAKANQILGMLDPNANVDRKIDEMAKMQHKISCLRTEPFRRWSNGFTCLCFALIGMPVAMLWRHADGLTNFFVCFLPILALYYPLLLLGDNLTTTARLPPIFFWMGNVVLTAPAIALLRWINRH